ncbi:MAG TPA: hypothetical protein VK604_18190 [Bryobacteraceae bacterium]|nr:hypothetical protein [Bryobacteraceae bacterium]
MEVLDRRKFLLAGVVAVLPPLAFAQAPAAKPNFSGRWRMVRDRSEFHGFKMPDMVVRVVDHHDPILNLHTVQTSGGNTTMADVVYTTDGTPATNTISGRPAQSKAFWDGTDLVIRTTMKTSKGDNEVIEDRWQLSADGETLTTHSHVETDRGGTDLKLVCVKDK